MKQAASLKNLELPLCSPGIRNNTSATDYRMIHQMYLMRFDGKKWVVFGDLQLDREACFPGFCSRPEPPCPSWERAGVEALPVFS
jgi:hypothetical protein